MFRRYLQLLRLFLLRDGASVRHIVKKQVIFMLRAKDVIFKSTISV